MDRNRAIFTVISLVGISHVVIARVSERWPESVVMRLQLKELGKFEVTNSVTTLEGSISSQDEKAVPWAWKDGDEGLRWILVATGG